MRNRMDVAALASLCLAVGVLSCSQTRTRAALALDPPAAATIAPATQAHGPLSGLGALTDEAPLISVDALESLWAELDLPAEQRPPWPAQVKGTRARAVGRDGGELLAAALQVPDEAAGIALVAHLTQDGGEGAAPRWYIGGERPVGAALVTVEDGGQCVVLVGGPDRDSVSEALCKLWRQTPPQLPDELGEWTRTGDVVRYDERTIFDYIDGAAERHTRYNLARMVRGEYANGDLRLGVEVYDMRSSSDAFGLFSSLGKGDPIEVGQAGAVKGRLLNYWHGPYYCEVRALVRQGVDTAALRDVADAVCLTLGPEGPEPVLVSGARKMPFPITSVRYFHDQKDQEDFLYVSTANLLRLSRETNGVMLKVKVGEDEAYVLGVHYPAGGDPHGAAADVRAAIARPGETVPEQEPYEWPTGKYVLLKVAAPDLLVGVFDAPSPELSQQILQEAGTCLLP